MDDNVILQMREEGYTYQEIAEKLGVSRQRVQQRVKRMKGRKPYYTQDITFCSNRECENKKCKRNHCHIDWSVKPYQSFCNFENTQYCLNKRSDTE